MSRDLLIGKMLAVKLLIMNKKDMLNEIKELSKRGPTVLNQ